MDNIESETKNVISDDIRYIWHTLYPYILNRTILYFSNYWYLINVTSYPVFVTFSILYILQYTLNFVENFYNKSVSSRRLNMPLLKYACFFLENAVAKTVVKTSKRCISAWFTNIPEVPEKLWTRIDEFRSEWGHNMYFWS